ncbi:MAG: hypothetical protein AAFW00_18665 [Bacteroidota bacterium]
MRSEIELIQSVANGEKQALVALYDLYTEKIYSIAVNYEKSVEDVTQGVFVKIYIGD